MKKIMALALGVTCLATISFAASPRIVQYDSVDKFFYPTDLLSSNVIEGTGIGVSVGGSGRLTFSATIIDVTNLTDVDLSYPITDGQALVWDNVSKKFTNLTVSAGSSQITNATDTSFSYPFSDGQVIAWDDVSKVWTNVAQSGGTSQLTNLTDVGISYPISEGHYLAWDDVSKVWTNITLAASSFQVTNATDVTISYPIAEGAVLTWDNTAKVFVNTTLTTPINEVTNLNDVGISYPITDGDFMVWDNVSKVFTNITADYTGTAGPILRFDTPLVYALTVSNAVTERLLLSNAEGQVTNAPAGTGGQTLITDGSTHFFGALDLEDEDAVTGILPLANLPATLAEWASVSTNEFAPTNSPVIHTPLVKGTLFVTNSAGSSVQITSGSIGTWIDDPLYFRINSTFRWYINNSGFAIVPVSTYDIGESGSRIGTLYSGSINITTPLALNMGGTGQSFSDPNEDAALVWDDMAGQMILAGLGANIALTGGDLVVSGSGIDAITNATDVDFSYPISDGQFVVWDNVSKVFTNITVGAGSGDSVSVNGASTTDADFDDATPTAPAGSLNVAWQKDSSGPDNVSASTPFNTTQFDVSGGSATIKALANVTNILGWGGESVFSALTANLFTNVLAYHPSLAGSETLALVIDTDGLVNAGPGYTGTAGPALRFDTPLVYALTVSNAVSERMLVSNAEGQVTNAPAGTGGQAWITDGSTHFFGALDLEDGDAVTGLLQIGNLASGATLDTEWDTSAEILAAIPDETGSGSLVASNRPFMTIPTALTRLEVVSGTSTNYVSDAGVVVVRVPVILAALAVDQRLRRVQDRVVRHCAAPPPVRCSGERIRAPAPASRAAARAP